MLGTLKNNF